MDLPSGERSVIMLCGLQGSGKTTMAGKLSIFLKKMGRQPMLVAADIYRPAAIDQLKIIGAKAEVPVYAPGAHMDPVDIARGSLSEGENLGRDTVILDTAGRLHIDEHMMEELVKIKAAVKPRYVLLVVDAMVGQDAVSQAKEFNSQLEIDGVILTKLDGDARGGAALSICEVTGKPILFAGVGEKLDQIERFHPDRMASRILGMGDIVTLVERAREVIDQEQAEEMQQKLLEQSFTLDDFLSQMQQIRKMGGMQDLLKYIPGMGAQLPPGFEVDEKEMARMGAIIQSMTPEERNFPQVIGGSRRKRIAKGSGAGVSDVNQLLKQFEESKRMAKNMARAMTGGIAGRALMGAASVANRLGLSKKDRVKAKARRKRERQARKKGRKR
jgi:signal recognition particle subunit SRP54